jgi:hypothetical protein
VSAPAQHAQPVSGVPTPPWSTTAPQWSSTAPPQAPNEPTTTGDRPDHVGAYHRDVAEEQEGRDQAPAYPDIETFPMREVPRPDAPDAFHQGPFGPPPAYPMIGEPEEHGRNRTAMIVAVVVTVLALAALVGVGVLLLSREAAPPSGPASPVAATATVAAPSATRPPPGGLRLRDDSATITLTWTDPTGGAVPFMVAGGRAGQKLGVMATVDPGQTSYTVNGLNSRVDYCFTVLAVYSTDSFATSGQVCTERENGTPAT